MHEFWVSSGHLLLDRSFAGLMVTDDFLRAFLARPELLPPPEACDAERDLHATLLANPRAVGSTSGIADPDAAENWNFFLGLRDRLVAAPSLEAAYLHLLRETDFPTPRAILDQFVHAILRNAFHGTHDAQMVRAGELFFREQRVTWHNNSLLLADSEIVDHAEHQRSHVPLMAFLAPPVAAELAVLTEETAHDYWGRSDAFDMVLDLGGPLDGRAALGRAMAAFIRHMLGFEIIIEPLPRIDTPEFDWFIGLDPDATRIGNAMWNGEELPESQQLLALYRAIPAADAPVLPAMVGRPIYLMLAANAEGRVRMKPQNLIMGLPLRENS